MSDAAQRHRRAVSGAPTAAGFLMSIHQAIRPRNRHRSLLSSTYIIQRLRSWLCPIKKRWTAFFLCLFLGWMGVHKFYLGKIGMGVLYFFTFGVFGIGWAIDLILLLFGISRDYQGRKLA